MVDLSIILPVYNAEKTLDRCIRSVLNQTYSNFELIIIDDGSIDDSLKICQEYAKQDDRVILYHKANEGLVVARKTGVRLATGQYIGFIDSDDFIEVDMYSLLMGEAHKMHSDIVMGGIKVDYLHYSVDILNNIPKGYYSKNEIKQKIIPNMLVKEGFYKYGIIPGVVIKIFKRELIKESLEFVSNVLTIGEDVAITSFSIIRANSISIIESVAYHYVQTETSMIRGYDQKRFEHICNTYKCIANIQDPNFNKQINAYFACLLYDVLCDCVKNGYENQKKTKEQIKKFLEDNISRQALKNVDVSKWSIYDRIKLFLMKKRLVGVLILILKR